MKKTGTLKLIILSAIALASMFTFIMMSQQKNINVIETYLSSSQSLVEIYDLNFNKKITLPRGTKIITQNITLEHNNQKYIKIKYENNEYLVLKENIDNEIVQEKTTYVRTPVVLYENSADSKIISYINMTLMIVVARLFIADITIRNIFIFGTMFQSITMLPFMYKLVNTKFGYRDGIFEPQI